MPVPSARQTPLECPPTASRLLHTAYWLSTCQHVCEPFSGSADGTVCIYDIDADTNNARQHDVCGVRIRKSHACTHKRNARTNAVRVICICGRELTRQSGTTTTAAHDNNDIVAAPPNGDIINDGGILADSPEEY